LIGSDRSEREEICSKSLSHKSKHDGKFFLNKKRIEALIVEIPLRAVAYNFASTNGFASDFILKSVVMFLRLLTILPQLRMSGAAQNAPYYPVQFSREVS
jgi:hypothetical protein